MKYALSEYAIVFTYNLNDRVNDGGHMQQPLAVAALEQSKEKEEKPVTEEVWSIDTSLFV